MPGRILSVLEVAGRAVTITNPGKVYFPRLAVPVSILISNLIGGTYEVMLVVGFNQPGPRLPPQKQTVNVSEDGETQVDFIIDLTQKGTAP